MAGPADAFRERVIELGTATLETLWIFETVARRLHPNVVPRLRERMSPLHERLSLARERFVAEPTPEGYEPLAEALERAGERVADALDAFLAPDAGVLGVLGAFRLSCRAQEALYPLRRALVPVGRFFAEPALHDALDTLDPEPPEDVEVGFFHVPGDPASGTRGGFALYVPETYRGERDWPLVIALHGGHGHGRDFLWTWLREARSRRVILMAPTSIGATWSFHGPDHDAAAIRQGLERVASRWRVDRTRVLLTGLSDGATYTLFTGLDRRAPFSALAPCSGVLHPTSFANGSLEHATGRRVYLVHGALDWMFPVEVARMARGALEKAGVDLRYREIEDLPHAHPREENAKILRWFDASLTLPGEAADR